LKKEMDEKLAAQQRAFEERVAAQERATDGLAARTGAVEGRIAAQERATGAVDGRLTVHKRNLEKQKEKVDRRREKLRVAILARMDADSEYASSSLYETTDHDRKTRRRAKGKGSGQNVWEEWR
jgi:uncharacterized coiled-coil protein SlyX